MEIVISLSIALLALFISIAALSKSYDDRYREDLEKLIEFARESHKQIKKMSKKGNTLYDFYSQSIFLPGFETYHLWMKRSNLIKIIDSILLREKSKILSEVRKIIYDSRSKFRNQKTNSINSPKLTQTEVAIIRKALSEIRNRLIDK